MDQIHHAPNGTFDCEEQVKLAAQIGIQQYCRVVARSFPFFRFVQSLVCSVNSSAMSRRSMIYIWIHVKAGFSTPGIFRPDHIDDNAYALLKSLALIIALS